LQVLPGRRGQRLPGADREHQREQHPWRDQPGDGQGTEGGRRDQYERLRGQQEARRSTRSPIEQPVPER